VRTVLRLGKLGRSVLRPYMKRRHHRCAL